MPHKLWIYPEIVPSERYKEFLYFFEVVASTPNILKLIVQNIGEEIFPGGEIFEGRVNFESVIGMSTFTQSLTVTKELPTIQPNETFAINIEGWAPFTPGLWQVKMKIRSKGNGKIEYYQRHEGPPLPQDEWSQFVYAVDRHQLDLTLLLKQLLSERR